MAPRSGWWQCASEQGSRLACWLEAIRVVAGGKPTRDCFFVALSGHELGLLGMEAYIKGRSDLIRRAHVWIFLSDYGRVARDPLGSARISATCVQLLRKDAVSPPRPGGVVSSLDAGGFRGSRAT